MVTALVSSAGPAMRQEPTLSFAIDEPFQRDGGVQYFYALVKQGAPSSDANVAFFRAFDEAGRWAAFGAGPRLPLHVVMSRIVYLVDKDASFFTEARAKDVAWMNTVFPDFDVSQRPDGGFRSGKTPANDFTIRFLSGAALASTSPGGGLANVRAMLPASSQLASVVVQENFDFSKVMGVRTGAFSSTWTAHEVVGPLKTRVHVFTTSAVHTMPPFFLGGEKRVFNESVRGALDLIERLRAAEK